MGHPSFVTGDEEQATAGGLWLGFDFLLNDLVGGDIDVLVFDVETKAVKKTHVDVSDPNQGKPGDEIAPPAVVEHLEARDDEKKRGDVVAETVFAGEEVEEFSAE